MAFTIKVRRDQKMDLLKVVTAMKGPRKVKVGFPAGEADSDVIDRAFFNEFGTRGGASGGGWGGPVPERPFLRNAVRNSNHGLRSVFGKQAQKLLRGETSLSQSLSKLGIYFSGKVQEEITSLSSPPNSPVTIALKGSSKPLIDSGEMRGAVTYKIGDF